MITFHFKLQRTEGIHHLLALAQIRITTLPKMSSNRNIFLIYLHQKAIIMIVHMFRATWEFALSVDSAALSEDPQKLQRFLGIPRKHSSFWGSLESAALCGNSKMAQHFLKSYDRVAEPACNARQSNYTQYQDTIFGAL